jgi:predicted extracellular nuclease
MIHTLIVTIVQLFFTSCNSNSEAQIVNPGEKTQVEKHQEPTPVLFYNVENLFDTIKDAYKQDDDFTPNGKLKWTRERYNAKLKNISKVISSAPDPPAIIGLVEIENKNVLTDLFHTGKLNDVNYKIITEESADERGIDVALVFDGGIFEEVNHQALTVFFKDEPNDKTRDVLYVQLKNSENEVLHLFVNHWPSRREGTLESEGKRLTAANVVKNKTSEIKSKDKNAKIIIMGDFNDNPNDKSISNVLGAKLEKDKKADFIGLLSDEYAAGSGTEIFKDKWNLFDQLIISKSLMNSKKGLSINPSSAVILKKDFMLYKDKKQDAMLPSRTYGGEKYYGGFSDHLPVYLILENL